MNVIVAGATGETGRSIVFGLLASPTDFNVSAIVRPASMQKHLVRDFTQRGVTIVAIDLSGPQEDLEKALQGQDVVICTSDPLNMELQNRLADAAKAAGVKRFVVNAFASVCPPTGVLELREAKERSINYIKNIYLPYTVIDVGWWYQGSLPRVPSGKIDYATTGIARFVGDGNVPSCLTDLRDIGGYVARIITDDRTVNKYVLAYNEVWTQEDIFKALEKTSGETIPRNPTTREEIVSSMEALKKEYQQDPSAKNMVYFFVSQYNNSLWLRGDNTPEKAAYLGYLDAKTLYPDFEFTKFADYVQEVWEGKAVGTYQDRNFDIA